jgi:hypothetical protein
LKQSPLTSPTTSTTMLSFRSPKTNGSMLAHTAISSPSTWEEKSMFLSLQEAIDYIEHKCHINGT